MVCEIVIALYSVRRCTGSVPFFHPPPLLRRYLGTGRISRQSRIGHLGLVCFRLWEVDYRTSCYDGDLVADGNSVVIRSNASGSPP